MRSNCHLIYSRNKYITCTQFWMQLLLICQQAILSEHYLSAKPASPLVSSPPATTSQSEISHHPLQLHNENQTRKTWQINTDSEHIANKSRVTCTPTSRLPGRNSLPCARWMAAAEQWETKSKEDRQDHLSHVWGRGNLEYRTLGHNLCYCKWNPQAV